MIKFKLFTLVIFLMGFVGCAETHIEYKEKLVPVKCEVPKTALPAYTGDLQQDIPNILIYTEILENDLNHCTGK